ncbi:MAG: ATP-binding cassette domain-containing protein, partial [Acidimicrobiales bacterium]
RPARHISSGEAQRVSLARALVLDPALLLLDEPFASVDAATRARLLDDLEALLGQTHLARASSSPTTSMRPSGSATGWRW